MEREALIELAETLDKARLQAKPTKPHATQQALYNRIGAVFVDTLMLILVEHDDITEMYDYILDGKTVREALALVEGAL